MWDGKREGDLGQIVRVSICVCTGRQITVWSKIGFVRTNPKMAGQFVRLFSLVRHTIIIDVCPAKNGICPRKIGLTGQFDRSQPGNYLQP